MDNAVAKAVHSAEMERLSIRRNVEHLVVGVRNACAHLSGGSTGEGDNGDLVWRYLSLLDEVFDSPGKLIGLAGSRRCQHEERPFARVELWWHNNTP